MTNEKSENKRGGTGKSVMRFIAFGGIQSLSESVKTSTSATRTFFETLVRPFKAMVRHGFKGDPSLRGKRIARDEILRMYGMDEAQAHKWAAMLRRNQYVMLFMCVITLVLGFMGGNGLSDSVRVVAMLAATLVLLSFVTIILRDEWRIEVLTGRRQEWMPFVDWLVGKITGRV